MTSPEDIVWNTITDSAKTRFDYVTFESDFDDGTMAENILFLTIIGHAQGESVEHIASDISTQLLLLGLGLDKDDLRQFVSSRMDDLPLEIKAASQALTFLNMGLQPPGILVQVRSILKG